MIFTLDRLLALRHATGKYVALQLEINFHSEEPEIEWTVYDGAKHYHAPTPEDAMRAAEHANGLGKLSSEMPAVML